MFCSKCGKQINDDAVFCAYCGEKVGVVSNTDEANEDFVQDLPTTKEGWMLLAIKESVRKSLKNPDSAQFGEFENIEKDSYGRTYAEIIIRATNSYGAIVPTRYAVGFYDVIDDGPCQVIPKSLYVLPNIMVGAQRVVAKKMMKFNSPR